MRTAAPGLPLPTACPMRSSGSGGGAGFVADFGDAAAAGSGSGSEPQAASARLATERQMTKRFILIMPLECMAPGSVASDRHGHATRNVVGHAVDVEIVHLDDVQPGG